MFRRYREDIVVDRPEMVYGNILLVPWVFNSDILKNEHKADVLMGHFDILGAIMNESGTESKFGIDPADFKNFNMVYSGHYHTPGTFSNNIQYLGSPFHTSFNDVEGVRGFWIYDTDGNTCEFVEFTNYPKFRRIKDTEPWDILKPSFIEGNIVELIFTKDHGIEGNIEIVENVKKLNPLTLIAKYVSIDESMSQEDMVDEDIEIKDHLGILQEYFEYSEQPEHINSTMLSKIAEAVYKETVNGKG
jgi:hypothetical protein